MRINKGLLFPHVIIRLYNLVLNLYTIHMKTCTSSTGGLLQQLDVDGFLYWLCSLKMFDKVIGKEVIIICL